MQIFAILRFLLFYFLATLSSKTSVSRMFGSDTICTKKTVFVVIISLIESFHLNRNVVIMWRGGYKNWRRSAGQPGLLSPMCVTEPNKFQDEIKAMILRTSPWPWLISIWIFSLLSCKAFFFNTPLWLWQLSACSPRCKLW